MDAKNLQILVQKAKDDILKEVNDRLPRKVGVIAVNHFKQNFRDGGWLDDGLHPWKRTKLKQWVDDVSSISSHQVGSWLQTEYDTAVIRAHQAADWREFERNKDIMPNLRWMPTTSTDPETTHKAFWQKRLNLPVDDPFWTKHHPGDHWNCKCSLEANDDAVVRPEDTSVDKPQPGLDNNPGKDGHIFNDTHPYFPSDCRHCPFNKGFKNKAAAFFKNEDKDCNNCSKVDAKTPDNASTLKKERNAIKIEAKTSLTSETFRNNDFPHEVKISGAGIKEWLNQPHEHYREKNKALLKLKELFEKAKYLGPTIDEKKRENVLYSHIFETKISGDKSWIIVHQMKWGEYYIHSISDSEKVASKIKKGL